MKRTVGFDIETWLLRPGLCAPRLACGTFSTLEGAGIYEADETIRVFGHLVTDPDTILVAHNTPFDIAGILEHACKLGHERLVGLTFEAYAEGRIRDTLVRERLINLAEGCLDFDDRGRSMGYRLADLVKRYFGADISATKSDPDAWRLRYWELDGAPADAWPTAARDYAIADAVYARELYAAQGVRAAALPFAGWCVGGTITNEVEQNRHAFALYLSSCWGLRTDPDAVGELRAGLVDDLGDLVEQLKEIGLVRANGSTNKKALQARVEAAYGGNPPQTKRTKKSSETWEPSTATSLAVLLEAEDPALHLYAKASRPRYHLRTSVPTLQWGCEVPITPRYTVVMATGRASSSGGRKAPRHKQISSGTNIQNQPKRDEFRRCYVPRRGWVYAGADYAQLELCTLAQVCIDLLGESKIAEAVRAGRDLHLVLAAQLVGLQYSEVSKATHKPERDFCKEANFGYPGGLGVDTFRRRLRIRAHKGELGWDVADKTREECEHVRDVWRASWPVVTEYLAYIGRLTERGGYVDQLRSGRTRRVGQDDYCSAANSYFQGLAADGALLAVWRVQRECYTVKSSPLYGCRLVAFVHDELLLECPAAQAPEAGDRLAEVMVEAMGEFTPDVPIKAEPALMLRWSKGAETVRDARGRLCIWGGTT